MEGIAGVTARITEITSRIATLAPAPPVSVTPATASTASTAPAASSGSRSSTSFASALDDALGSATATRTASARTTAAPAPSWATTAAAAPAAPAASGRLTADGVPVELARFGNGKIPASALQEIGVHHHKLWSPAADAFTRMTAVAKRDGVTIGVTDSYRSYEAQVDVARRKGLYSEGGLAAKPGTSDHGWGRSLDLDLNSTAQTWMRANAGRFGFSEDVPREPWHWTFSPS